MPTNSFAHLPVTPAEHFRLYFYAAVLQLVEQVSQSLGGLDAALEQFPFLASYVSEPQALGGEAAQSAQAWRAAMCEWEETTAAHLPLRDLQETFRLDHSTLTLLMGIGLIEEDARFGLVFETMQGTPGQHRPTHSLLNAWWREENGWIEVRAKMRQLQDCGLVRVVNPEAPRLEWVLEIPSVLWDALRGEQRARPAPWARFRPSAELAPLDAIILPQELQRQLALIPALLAAGPVQALIVRGAQHNGRRTVLGAIARALGQGTLEIAGFDKADDDRWRLVWPLAAALHALPVLIFDLAPQETAPIPGLPEFSGALGIVLGKDGSVSGDLAERALTMALPMPAAGARRRHWQVAGGCDGPGELDAVSERFRLTSGNIRRAARLAQSYAALSGHKSISVHAVREATRALNRRTLDALAMRLDTFGDWNQVAFNAETQRELANLEQRCRQRERLRDCVGPALGVQLNSGVRALLSGPSGTGKTLAARLLAAALELDLYRLDLSSVVNKYIGETEKNLNQIFSRAEELDVILLLDEGDALLTQRTSVQTSNDRYANLETNFLLQRLESFEGILLITTNAGERIDSAFQRRMDAVIAFHPPEVEERWAIWQMHLPPAHTLPPAFLEEVAQHCKLSGGQIRNAALHAALLALEAGGGLNALHVLTAVQREYRKSGAVCPLRPTNLVSSR